LLLTGEISFGQQAFFAIGAYAAGIATAMWGWPLAAGLAWGAATGAAAAALVGVPTLRLHGLYFAIATLAFAEMVRLLFELFRYQIVVDGELVGPNGADGFRGIRYIFENDVSAADLWLAGGDARRLPAARSRAPGRKLPHDRRR
jgi:branched-chain amino acid transport system permease protein